MATRGPNGPRTRTTESPADIKPGRNLTKTATRDENHKGEEANKRGQTGTSGTKSVTKKQTRPEQHEKGGRKTESVQVSNVMEGTADVRRSSRHSETRKSALELLGVSPRKPRVSKTKVEKVLRKQLPDSIKVIPAANVEAFPREKSLLRQSKDVSAHQTKVNTDKPRVETTKTTQGPYVAKNFFENSTALFSANQSTAVKQDSLQTPLVKANSENSSNETQKSSISSNLPVVQESGGSADPVSVEGMTTNVASQEESHVSVTADNPPDDSMGIISTGLDREAQDRSAFEMISSLINASEDQEVKSCVVPENLNQSQGDEESITPLDSSKETEAPSGTEVNSITLENNINRSKRKNDSESEDEPSLKEQKLSETIGTEAVFVQDQSEVTIIESEVTESIAEDADNVIYLTTDQEEGNAVQGAHISMADESVSRRSPTEAVFLVPEEGADNEVLHMQGEVIGYSEIQNEQVLDQTTPLEVSGKVEGIPQESSTIAEEINTEPEIQYPMEQTSTTCMADQSVSDVEHILSTEPETVASPSKAIAKTPKKVIPKKKRRKKIVKAVVITPSGERKEIRLAEGVSTIKALEQILAGTTEGTREDLEKLASDVNDQIEASMNSDANMDTQAKEAGHVTQFSELNQSKKVVTITDPNNVEVSYPENEADAFTTEQQTEGEHAGIDDNGLITLVTNVDANDKMAFEALSQLASGSQGNHPITIELKDASSMDMDWLQQQGLRVVFASEHDDQWNREMVGVQDPPALAQLVNKMTRSKVRARPQKHLVASASLKEMIDNLEPDDNMANHVRYHIANNTRLLKCKYCEVLINDKHEFRKHIATHKEIDYKPWKCPICHYRAMVRAQIARHVNIHGEMKPFVCKECGKGFNFKQKLHLHLKYHLDIRDRPCPYCNMAFHELKTLKNHLRKIHKLEHVPPELVAKVKEPESKDPKRTRAEAERLLQVAREQAAYLQTNAEPMPQRIEEPEKDPTTNLEKTDVAKVKRISNLYGTRKTFLYTQQYRMGLLSAADRNDMPMTETITIQPPKPIQSTESSGEKKRPRVVIPKITSTEQLEPTLQKYCCVKKDADGFSVKFFCQLCEIEPFTSKTGFIHHLEQRHPKVRAWQCPQCPYNCRMRSSLIVHMKLHTGIKDHTCEVCGKAFAFKQKLKNHMKHHLNLREFPCHLCEKAFNEKNDLVKHIKKVHHAERDCICNVCGKGFKDQVQLRRHMDGHSNTRYLCEHCNKLYRSRVSLAQHMKCHTCMFHCEICDKNFGSYSGFMAHKVMHDESYEGYECDLCKKVLHTKGSLTRHLAISHSNDRPHTCEECKKQFKTKKDLKNHHIVHQTDRKFSCEVCEFTCKRPESLRVHMRRHSDVKPYICGVCGKEYTQKNALETHLRHHTGKVEGACPVCGREFFTRYQLETHMKRKHKVKIGPDNESAADGQEKPVTVFMCEECNAVFMSQDSLAVHILAEHMKQGWQGLPGVPEPGVPGQSNMAKSLLNPQLRTSVETLEETPIGNMVDIVPESTGVSLPSQEDMQTVETLVSISDPGSSRQRYVSLIHPIDTRTDRRNISAVRKAANPVPSTNTITEPQRETATQKLNALYDPQPEHESYVAITDPSSNQEMLVAMPHSNFESLLAATEAEVHTDGTFIGAPGEDFITVNSDGSGLSTETFVTISNDVMEPGCAMGAMAAGREQREESGVAVAETIEIPIETECVTVLDDTQ